MLRCIFGSVSKPPKNGKWMFIPLKMVLIGIDPYPFKKVNSLVVEPS
jgi:hypothetical protein